MTEPTQKKCLQCNTVKSLDNFSPLQGGYLGRHSHCKPCRNTRNTELRPTRTPRRRVNTKPAAPVLTQKRHEVIINKFRFMQHHDSIRRESQQRDKGQPIDPPFYAWYGGTVASYDALVSNVKLYLNGQQMK